MPRRAEIVVDIRVGNITIPGGPITVPAQLTFPPGRNPPSPGPGPGPGPAPGPRPPAGPRIPFPPGIIGQYGRFAAGFLANYATIIAGVTLAIFAFVAALKALQAILSLLAKVVAVLVAGLKLLAQAFFAALAALVRFATAVQAALLRLATWAVQRSIDALNFLVQKAVQAGRALYELGARFVRSATTTFAAFQQEVVNTVTVMGVFGPAATAMQEQVRAVAMEVTQWSRRTPTEVAKAAYDIASAGFSTVAELQALTKATVVLSEATLTPLEQVSESLMATVNQFQLGAAGAMRAANAMADVIARTPATMDKLTVSLKQSGTTAAQFGWSLEATLAALGGLFLVGHNGSIAGTEISNMFNSLVKMGARAEVGLKKVGLGARAMLDALKRGPAELVALVESVERVYGRATVTEAYQQAMTLRASRGLAGLMAVGSARLRELQSQITGTNTAVNMQRDQLKTLAATWDRMRSVWERARIAFGGGLAETLTPALGVLIEFVGTLTKGGVFEYLGKLAGYVGGVLVEAFVRLEPTILWLVNALVNWLGAAIPRAISLVQSLIPVARALGSAFMEFVGTVGPQLLALFRELGSVIVTQLLANKDLIIAWFTMLVGVARRLVAALPRLAPIIRMLVVFFIRWIPYLAQVAVYLLPMLVKAAVALLPQLLNLAMVAIPVLIAGFVRFLPLAVRLGEVALPAAANAILWLVNTILYLLPVALHIASKAVDYLRLLFANLGLSATKLRETLKKLLSWIDANFYDIIMTACDAADVFIGFLRMLAGAATVLGIVLGSSGLTMVVGILTGAFAAFAGACWAGTMALVGIVEAYDALTGQDHSRVIAGLRLEAKAWAETAKAATISAAAILAAPAIAAGLGLGAQVALTVGQQKVEAARAAAKQAKALRGKEPVPAGGATLPPLQPMKLEYQPGPVPPIPEQPIPTEWDIPAFPPIGTQVVPVKFEAAGSPGGTAASAAGGAGGAITISKLAPRVPLGWFKQTMYQADLQAAYAKGADEVARIKKEWMQEDVVAGVRTYGGAAAATAESAATAPTGLPVFIVGDQAAKLTGLFDGVAATAEAVGRTEPFLRNLDSNLQEKVRIERTMLPVQQRMADSLSKLVEIGRSILAMMTTSPVLAEAQKQLVGAGRTAASLAETQRRNVGPGRVAASLAQAQQRAFPSPAAGPSLAQAMRLRPVPRQYEAMTQPLPARRPVTVTAEGARTFAGAAQYHVHIGGNVYGVDDLKKAMREGFSDARRDEQRGDRLRAGDRTAY